jgi:hypothetical protein
VSAPFAQMKFAQIGLMTFAITGTRASLLIQQIVHDYLIVLVQTSVQVAQTDPVTSVKHLPEEQKNINVRFGKCCSSNVM